MPPPSDSFGVSLAPDRGPDGRPAIEDAEQELRAAAQREAARWEATPSARGFLQPLRNRRQKALLSLRRAEKWIERLSARGCRLPLEARWIVEHNAELWATFRETAQTLRSETLLKLPAVRNPKREVIPRAYALARGFFQAAHFAFREQDLLAYLDAAQSLEPLDVNEVWTMKFMLQIALLDQIGMAADAFCAEMEKNARTLSLRSDASQHDFPVLIQTLQAINRVNWLRIFEAANRTEEILQKDPAGVYSQMEAESRDYYRKAVVQLAAHSGHRETEVAALAVDLAGKAQVKLHEDPRLYARRKHVGYYLLDEGRKSVEADIHYQPPIHQKIERFLLRWPEVSYAVGIEVVTVGIIAFLLSGLGVALPPLAAIVLLLLPATESAVRIVNQLVIFLIRPRPLVKMDFACGIPAECTTMVVVPTLLLSVGQVRETVRNLEIRYLANPDANLHFVLLTDSPDSTRSFDEKDETVELAVKLIEELNRKYGSQRRGSFFLFHRHRLYNEGEGAWMGWERKRGKLLDLNRLLRNDSDCFPVKAGDLSVLPNVRYVITLDSDTSLPRETAQRLVGALAHPLNKAVIDRSANTVVKGYGILQPRVGISVHSAVRSRLASLLSGQSGFDLYTRAVSDVYQDLFGEGSFTGKGIYEVDVYQRVLAQRFPCNALLSHDLIEGSYVRAGLVSDVEVIDDYPSHFSAYSRRKHRWVRGDWQILRWLFNRVPGYSGKPAPNPISFISRWKILDNLRRSLIEAAVLALLIGGWFFLPGGPAYWTIATLVLLLMPSYLQIVLHFLSAGASENWPGAMKEGLKNFIAEQVNVLLMFIFLLHQALVTLDAIVRTLVRLAVTHKKLLEWETAAQAELRAKKKTPVEIGLDLALWFSIALGAALAYFHPRSLPEALPFLLVWACSKPVAHWVDRPFPYLRRGLASGDKALLREYALRTWRFFCEWSRAETNFLIPDNIQESPWHAASVISPTNLGFLLTARLAAFDLGYLTVEDFVRETRQSLEAAQRMRRFKGHFFNWSDIKTLEPIEPLFISTVDSGNLAACLWVLKQGCLEIIERPLFEAPRWQGLRDPLNLLRGLAKKKSISKGALSAFDDLQRRFALLGDRSSAWIADLPRLEQKALELEAMLSEEHGVANQGEMLWWAAELRRRLASLQDCVRNLTPWLLPEHRSLFLYPNTLPRVDLSRLTLAALPQTLEDIESRLENLAGSPVAEVKVRSQAHSFLQNLRSSLHRAAGLIGSLQRLAEISDSLVEGMDFRFLYDPNWMVFSVGYNITAERLEGSSYDLLASEARTASFIAIAKGDVRQESWFHLGRSHTAYEGERVLLSWSGTMFEYLMPALWMKTYPDTILGQSQHAAVRCQQKFGQRKRRPWGVSEAAWSKRDAEGLYQYRAFGIPILALSPGVRSDVVAPYATFLALETDPEGACLNLQRMRGEGWLGAYGFYESADYRPRKRAKRAKYELIRSWMAHHQGMTLLALCNLLADSSIQRRFHAEPRCQATELILHERIPGAVPIVPNETASPVDKAAELAEETTAS